MRWFGRSRACPPEAEPPTSREAEPARILVVSADGPRPDTAPRARVVPSESGPGRTPDAAPGVDRGPTRTQADARALGAVSFTSGRDAYFTAGAYALDVPSARRILAHEPACAPRPMGDGEQTALRPETATANRRATLSDRLPWDEITLSGFAADGDEPVAEHRGALADLAGELGRVLKTHPDTFVTIDGRADAAEANSADLSRRRADAVLSILAAQGVAARAMRAGGLSKEVPRGATPVEAARNRRVVIQVIKRDFHAEHRVKADAHGGPSKDSRVWIDDEIRRLGLPEALRGRVYDLAAAARDRGIATAVDALARDPSIDAATRKAVRTILKGALKLR